LCQSIRDKCQGIGVCFFQYQNSFKSAYFEEKIHRKGGKAEEGRGKKDLSAKTSSPYSISRKNSSKIWYFFGT
jgi:hypothetical protein